MSNAFRCDACDEFYSGDPSLELDVTASRHTMGVHQLQLGRNSIDDPFPETDEKRTVDFEPNRTDLQLCSECTADYIIPALNDAFEQGRYAVDDE
jgi:hypothetical protein